MSQSSRNEEDTEECPICYDTLIIIDGGEAGNDEEKIIGETQCYPRNSKEGIQVQDCHKFCRECLVNHCKYSVSNREVPIKCPGHECTNILPDDQIKDLVLSASTDWIRFQRVQKLLQDPSLISCSRCEEVVSKGEHSVQGIENQVKCPSCYHSFCTIHGDAHAGIPCPEYKPSRETRRSERAIKALTRPCSHCGVPIQKESGCDHIICLACKDDMCFRCGTHNYLEGDTVRHCTNCEQHFVDHRRIWSYRLVVCLSLPLYLPIMILHVFVMAALALGTFGCCCCLGCGVNRNSNDKVTFSPIKATIQVLNLVFLPVIDLFRQCGIECCCPLSDSSQAAKGLENNATIDEDESDDASGSNV